MKKVGPNKSHGWDSFGKSLGTPGYHPLVLKMIYLNKYCTEYMFLVIIVCIS